MSAAMTDEYQIEACLARHVASIRETAPHSWEFVLGTARGTAMAELEWLLVDLPLGRSRRTTTPTASQLADVLSLAAQLDGPARFTFDARTKRLHLQAEIPLVLDDDPMERIDLGFVSLEQSLGRFGSEKAAGTLRVPSAEAPPAQDEGPTKEEERTAQGTVPAALGELSARYARWKQLCEEATWPLHERTSSKLAVSLDVPGSFCQAIVEAHGRNSVRIRYEAGRIALSDAGRQAVAAFLLASARSVRMTRAYMETDAGPDGACGFGWEIVLHDPPDLFEIERALSALSTACRATTNERAVLANDEVAARYLAVQGMVS